jgi:hypothetical protein
MVDFYPFYRATTGDGPACAWPLGMAVQATMNDFGQIKQHGPLLGLTFLMFGGVGTTASPFNDFRNIVSDIPCTA